MADTDTGIRDRVATLSADERERLHRKLFEERSAPADVVRPRRRDGTAPPLSFAQERLWFLERLAPGLSVYTIPTSMRVAFPLDGTVLQRALDEIARRHEVLRSTFDLRDAKPVQIIAPALQVPLAYGDLRTLPPLAALAEAQRIADAEARRPFDLARGPLFRAGVIQLGDVDFIVLLTLHHIVADGWSVDILFRELAVLYEAFASGHPSPLPELPIQYADYAVWQRERAAAGAFDADLAYWRERLRGAPPLSSPPADRPHPALQSFAGGSEIVATDRATTDALKSLAQRSGATLFMVLLAAFDVLLARSSGETDIVVGTPIANRTRAELEPLIGFFTNSLVLRTDVAGDPTFTELLARVRATTLDAYAHQDLSFERLVEELQPDRSLAHNPLFQTVFTLQNTPGAAAGSGDTGAAPSAAAPGSSSKFDFSLALADTPAGLRGAVEYATDLYDAATVARMVARWNELLAGIVRDPSARMSSLPLLPAAERALVASWTKPEHPFAARTLHALIEEQAARTPDAVAASFDGVELTYAELDARAERLARVLRANRVAPGTRVGICLERSLEFVVAILGVLKSGGAYVPLDPVYPADRLRFMADDAALSALVTHTRLRDALPPGPARVLCIDALPAIAAAHDPVQRATPDDIAYVIYTSGSTGTPKGVMISHRGVCSLVAAQRSIFAPGPGYRVLQFSPLSFDMSVYELTLALCNGGTLCLARREALMPGPNLAQLIEDERITYATLPPSALAALPHVEAPALTTIITGGEPCPLALLAAWATPRRRTFNGYGPTEVSVWSTVEECFADSTSLTLGRPIPNVHARVLDAALHEVPIGAPGELYLAGPALARGYLRRAGLTADRFVPSPFGAPGERMYRTGDVVRHLADGRIDFLGRGDEQVKLRGFRIELGEIEATLRRNAAVRDAAVAVRTREDGDRRLVAYVVPAGGVHPSAADLRAALVDALPEHMIPAAYVVLDALPLTPNGKVDRRALPEPVAQRDTAARDYVAPRTPLEVTLAGIWSEVLGLERVGADDDFFALGGHSLLATQVVSRVRDALGVELPLRRMFEDRTLERLAAADEFRAAPAAPPQRDAIPRARAAARLA
jgi:amino acid adenylation domain-containing protein